MSLQFEHMTQCHDSVHDFQVKDARALKKELEEAGKELVPILEGNLVDIVWGADRPRAPATSLRTHKLEFAGMSVAEKIEVAREQLEGKSRTRS